MVRLLVVADAILYANGAQYAIYVIFKFASLHFLNLQPTVGEEHAIMYIGLHWIQFIIIPAYLIIIISSVLIRRLLFATRSMSINSQRIHRQTFKVSIYDGVNTWALNHQPVERVDGLEPMCAER